MTMLEPGQTLVDLTDEQLREHLTRAGSHVQYGYRDVLGEMNRRAQDRLAGRAWWLSLVIGAATVINAAVAVVYVDW